jgi:hypothetical protein
MEDLLKNDFTSHYALPVAVVADFIIETDIPYFEIEDTPAKELVIHASRNVGGAKFSNPNSLNVNIANYDKFLTSLPQAFQHGKERCDIILTSNTNRYFILGELKDRIPKSKVRTKAKNQLITSLRLLIAVPSISAIINSKAVKRCCYFNKQSNSPALLTATRAFNRLSTFFPEGFQMSEPVIESFGFAFFEYTGEQTMQLTS